jgi:DNA invertase Pin-like site-specific DNA recombinase
VFYGYARVSTSDQSHQGQVEQLTAAGAAKVFSEKISGATADRPELQRAIAALDAGDVLLVTDIDRLARSTRDLLNILHEIKRQGATLRSLRDPWVNTDTETGELLLTLLGAVAKLERSMILRRTAEGRARAKERGRSLGRKPKLNAVQIMEAQVMKAQGRGLREIGAILGCDASTVSRALRDEEDVEADDQAVC